jgi:hypothetical protein
MSEDDNNKNKLATKENLSRLVTVMAGDSASLQCKASACSVVFNVCTQTKQKAEMETMPFINGMGGGDGDGGGESGDAGESVDAGGDDPGFDAPAGGGGGGGAGSADPMSATGASLSFSDMPTINAAVGGSAVTVGLYTFTAVDPYLERAWFPPLHLKCGDISWFQSLRFQMQRVPLRHGGLRGRRRRDGALFRGAQATGDGGDGQLESTRL